jgi:acyl carrier protein
LTALSAEQLAKLYRDVQSVLAETLSLGQRAYQVTPASALLGALPELDSQAVLSLLMGIEERFGVPIADDEVDAEIFATLESLTSFVATKISGR